MVVECYTDGSAVGPYGGWAVMIMGKLYSGCKTNSTNNTMEMWAIYEAIKLAPEGVILQVSTDSKLAIGWLRQGKRYIANDEEIKTIRTNIDLMMIQKNIVIRLKKVKAHTSDDSNRRVDEAARKAARELAAQNVIITNKIPM